MPNKKTIQKAQQDKREGKSPSTQAGEFVRETIDEIRQGKHGARSTKQAIAIGLSKARRAGVQLKLPAKGKASEETRLHAQRDNLRGQTEPKHRVSVKRSRAATKALQREGRDAVSHEALSKQAREQAGKRPAKEQSAIGRKAARTRKTHRTPAK